MDKIKALYMFRDETANPDKHRTIVETPSVILTVVGFNDFKEGIKVAKQMVQNGVQLIELCGACGYEGAKIISEAVGNKVPVGMIVHQFDNAPKICEFLKSLD